MSKLTQILEHLIEHPNAAIANSVESDNVPKMPDSDAYWAQDFHFYIAPKKEALCTAEELEAFT